MPSKLSEMSGHFRCASRRASFPNLPFPLCLRSTLFWSILGCSLLLLIGESCCQSVVQRMTGDEQQLARDEESPSPPSIGMEGQMTFWTTTTEWDGTTSADFTDGIISTRQQPNVHKSAYISLSDFGPSTVSSSTSLPNSLQLAAKDNKNSFFATSTSTETVLSQTAEESEENIKANSSASSSNSNLSFSFVFSWDIFLTLILPYSIIFVLAVVGNLLVIITLTLNRSMRSVTNIFLLNLAISDLLLGVFCMPATLVGVLLRRFIFGRFMCHLISYMQSKRKLTVKLLTHISQLPSFFALLSRFSGRQRVDVGGDVH